MKKTLKAISAIERATSTVWCMMSKSNVVIYHDGDHIYKAVITYKTSKLVVKVTKLLDLLRVVKNAEKHEDSKREFWST